MGPAFNRIRATASQNHGANLRGHRLLSFHLVGHRLFVQSRGRHPPSSRTR